MSAIEGVNRNDFFEWLTQWYYRETGRMPPGKDEGIDGQGSDEYFKKRVDDWCDWLFVAYAKIIKAIDGPAEREGGRYERLATFKINVSDIIYNPEYSPRDCHTHIINELTAVDGVETYSTAEREGGGENISIEGYCPCCKCELDHLDGEEHECRGCKGIFWIKRTKSGKFAGYEGNLYFFPANPLGGGLNPEALKQEAQG